MKLSFRFPSAVLSFSFLCFCAGSFGCNEKKEVPPSASDKEAKPPVEAKEEPKEDPKPLALGHRFPVGPRLVFLPGQGVSAIRFGATPETVERHMGMPCDKKTEERCLYVRAAVEFFFKDGVVERIKAHRRDRKVEAPPEDGEKYFGSLRGIVQPRIMLGLHRHVVLEEFGEPKKKEAVNPPGPDGLVDRHIYDGIAFEYDKIENGNTVLAAIEVLPSETPYKPPKAQGASTGLVPAEGLAPGAVTPPSERAK